MSQKFRDLAFEIHKWSGLATFLLLFVAAVTGCILTFRQPIDAWLNPDLLGVVPPRPALSLPDLTDRVEGQRPDLRVVLAIARPGPGRASVLEVAPRNPAVRLSYSQVFADPSTGRILGDRLQRAGWDRRHILQGVYELHVRLFAGSTGRTVLGATSGVWLASSLVGFYLTLPRSGPFWRRWRSQWSVAWRARLPRVMLDLHRASGLWFFVGVLAVSATGLLLNFYSEFSEPLAQALSPSRFTEPSGRPEPAGARSLGYADAIRIARDRARSDGRPLRLAVASFEPEEHLFRIGFSASGARDYWWLGPTYYYVDAATGAVVACDDPYRDSAGRVFLRGLFPIHSGRILGWVARLYIFTTGLATAVMAVTGVYVWFRKEKARAAARVAAARATP
ncbi:MAG: peptidase [Phenylobacterium sp.]|uniref:PepSY-associated TM helix domain-containing protein n=1 Tax=Phenylobacterium sp. TaxID=1871053 RepID=UPI002622B344|nr:PepSY-associated TM helix domain-containing protein [Phenylobacterium sp.]MDB5498080.1 peptidase [Phenylobacterium sp.]